MSGVEPPTWRRAEGRARARYQGRGEASDQLDQRRTARPVGFVPVSKDLASALSPRRRAGHTSPCALAGLCDSCRHQKRDPQHAREHVLAVRALEDRPEASRSTRACPCWSAAATEPAEARSDASEPSTTVWPSSADAGVRRTSSAIRARRTGRPGISSPLAARPSPCRRVPRPPVARSCMVPARTAVTFQRNVLLLAGLERPSAHVSRRRSRRPRAPRPWTRGSCRSPRAAVDHEHRPVGIGKVGVVLALVEALHGDGDVRDRLVRRRCARRSRGRLLRELLLAGNLASTTSTLEVARAARSRPGALRRRTRRGQRAQTPRRSPLQSPPPQSERNIPRASAPLHGGSPWQPDRAMT